MPIQQRKNKPVTTRTPMWIRLVAATMLVAFVYYFAGYRLFSYILTLHAKSEAALVIKNKSSVETLTMSTEEFSQLKWTEDGKEFTLDGQLYDISSVTKTDNGYVLKVYFDKNETGLVKSLHDFVKELFPADNTKDSKDAEGFMSAFQKEYLQVNKFQLTSPSAISLINYSDSFTIPAQISGSGVWHPPAVC